MRRIGVALFTCDRSNVNNSTRSMIGTAARQVRYAATRLTSTTRRQTDGSSSQVGAFPQ